MTETTIYLQVSWSISRGRDTYGYNIARLDDVESGKRYRCSGGGYDMTGTVFGHWLADRFAGRLTELSDRSDAVTRYEGGEYVRTDRFDRRPESLYGMTVRSDDGAVTRVHLDGACGLSSMERVAEAIGLRVRHLANRRGALTGFMITDTRGE